ncbi:MAG: MarR family winged helix-turn-helix transcriptional regulator [Intestinibacter sp.]
MKITDDEIIQAFYNVSRTIRHSYSPNGNDSNLGPFIGQYRCLLYLENTKPINQKDLANALNIRPASLSELLSKLEQKKYIIRTPSEKDKRNILVSLSEEGIAEAKQCKKNQKKFHSKILSSLSEEEKIQFYNILLKINDSNQKG